MKSVQRSPQSQHLKGLSAIDDRGAVLHGAEQKLADIPFTATQARALVFGLADPPIKKGTGMKLFQFLALVQNMDPQTELLIDAGPTAYSRRVVDLDWMPLGKRLVLKPEGA